MRKKLIGICALAFFSVWCASAQQRVANRHSASRKVRIEVPDTVVREVGERIVTEEPVGKRETRVKVKKPKDMKYRTTYLEIEYETAPYRTRIASASEAEKEGVYKELLEGLSKIEHVRHAELDNGKSMVLVTLDDESEFRVKL